MAIVPENGSAVGRVFTLAARVADAVIGVTENHHIELTLLGHSPEWPSLLVFLIFQRFL